MVSPRRSATARYPVEPIRIEQIFPTFLKCKDGSRGLRSQRRYVFRASRRTGAGSWRYVCQNLRLVDDFMQRLHAPRSDVVAQLGQEMIELARSRVGCGL